MNKICKYLVKSGLMIIAVIGIASSCRLFKHKPPPLVERYGTFKFRQKADEIYMSPAFNAFLKANPFCSVVLRVPSKSGNVVEEETSFNRSMYFEVEKTILKNNFKVRDRSLFVQKYKENTKKKETDLILELVTFKRVNYYTNKVVPETQPEETLETTLPQYFYFTGAYAEFKITNIATNEVMATFILNYTPCTKGCRMKYSNYGDITTVEGDFKTRKKNGYESIDLDEDAEMFSELANRLVAELRKDIK